MKIPELAVSANKYSVRAVRDFDHIGFDNFIKTYMKDNPELFEEQGEFETTKQFNIRSLNAYKYISNLKIEFSKLLVIKKQKEIENEKYRKEQEEINKIIAKKESIQPIDLKIIEISKYNSDNQFFNIKLENNFYYKVNIPITSAPNFKINYERT